MFKQIYSNLKKRYQQSWFRFFLQYTALGKLLEHHTTVDAVTFYDTCLSSWWWNRLWLRSFMEDRYSLQQFDTVLDSLWLLEKAKISTQKNRALIANHPHPADLAIALSHLQKAGILTQENLVLVARHANPDNLASAFSDLQKAGILTQENLVLVARHANPESLAFAFSYLQKSRILTQTNFALVANHAHPYSLAFAFSHLKTARILTQKNRTLVAKHAHLCRLARVLSYLQTAGILTQANFDMLIDPHHMALLATESQQVVWPIITPDLLTQAHFEKLVRAAEQANPMTALQRALHLILLTGPAAFNQAQSTHTASESAVEARLWDEFKEADANKPEDPGFNAMIEYEHDSHALDLTIIYARSEANSGYEAFLYPLQQKNPPQQPFFYRSNQHGLWTSRNNQNIFDREFATVSLS